MPRALTAPRAASLERHQALRVDDPHRHALVVVYPCLGHRRLDEALYAGSRWTGMLSIVRCPP